MIPERFWNDFGTDLERIWNDCSSNLERFRFKIHTLELSAPSQNLEPRLKNQDSEFKIMSLPIVTEITMPKNDARQFHTSQKKLDYENLSGIHRIKMLSYRFIPSPRTDSAIKTVKTLDSFRLFWA